VCLETQSSRFAFVTKIYGNDNISASLAGWGWLTRRQRWEGLSQIRLASTVCTGEQTRRKIQEPKKGRRKAPGEAGGESVR